MAAIPLWVLMGGAALVKWWLGSQANDQAADRQYAALGQAQGAIQGAADKAMSYQQPYLQNAGADFEQFRNLVQSGFFQQPYGKSFQSQSFQGPSFAFNPKQGTASFASWQPQGGPASFTPQALPGMPQQPPPQAAPQPTQMTRPNALPQSVQDWRIATGADIVDRNTVQNMPQTPAYTRPGQQNPLNPNAIQNPYPSNPATPKSIEELMAIMRQGSLPHGPGGSGPLIPQTYRST